MISLGRRDGREDLGIGFGSEREMEDTELEEGEACSYHNINNNDDDYDASMDPDIALSYIDEKLQDVLGHFQKDFEGGVSAENLGAKFGGYGSFLPTYQRSPGWSHPRTSPKIQHRNASRSPNNLQLEGGRRSSVSSSTASQSLRLEPSSTVLKTTSSLNETVKQEACVPSTHFAEELVPRDECVNRKSASLQKMLKVRIKVGSDNLSTQKNAAIYSGLGLDVSPSSSMDDSPSESEGMSHDPQDAYLESPNYILQIMTSFPVHGALLLSPLPDDLLHLKEMEKFIKDSGCLSVPRFGPENSCIVVNGSSSVKGDGTMFGEKKIKSMARNELSAESKSDINKDSGIGVGVISKEIELDTFACEELVSNTLKLPLLSNSYSAVVGTSKGMVRASNVSKGVMSDKGFSGLTKEELPVPVSTQENGSIKNSKSKSSGKVWEDRKAISLGSDSVSPRKDGHRKGEKPHESVKIDSNVSRGRKAQNQAPTEPAKQNADEKAMSYEQEGMKLPHAKESSSEGKKKLKGSQSHSIVVAEAPKESLRLNSSLAPKNKKSSYADNYTTKVESEDLKLQKNSGKAGDRYREFFGDMEPEQEEFRMSTLVKSYEDRLEGFEMVELGTHGTNSTSKERSSSKKVDNLLTSEAFPKPASTGALHNGDGPITDTAPAEDNWVCCDKCQTWRLLPPRTNPDDLPEKWLCSMLDWLPGMNRCSFSEDETTLATRSLKQNTSGGDISKETVAGVWHPDQSHQNFGSQAALPGGRKKHGSKELSNMMYKEDGPIQLSNHTKKSVHAPVTNRGLNDVKPALVVSEPDSLKPSKSNLAAEKHKHKPKDKHRGLDNFSDRGGGSKRSKGKGKRDPDQDCFRASKKIRTEGFPEDWTSDHGGAIEKVGPPSSNGLAMASSGKNPPKYNDCTSKNMKHDQKDWAQLSAKNPKEDVRASLDNGSVDMGNCDDRDTKKRKVKESHDAQLYQDSLPNTGHHLQDSNIMAKEEFSENDYRKVKKPRVSRSEGKEASGSKSNGRTDKKGSHRKNQQLRHDLGSTLSQRSLDGVDSLKRDSGSLHVAANSSSSKVSGSHKTKSNFPDAKGSPVESVSSSPMRVSKPEKLASARKNVTKKDASVDAGFFAPGGPRRFSDGEDDGGNDQSGTARKAKTLVHIVPSPDIADGHLSNDVDFLSQNTPHRSKPAALDPCHDDERRNENHHLVNGSRPRKSGKGSSSRSKDKTRKFNSEFENEVKVSNSFNAEAPSYEVRLTNCKNKTEVKLGIKPEENEDRYVDKKEYQGQVLSDNSKRVNQLNVRGPSGSDVEVGATRNHDAVSTPKQSVLIDNEKVSDRGTTQSLPSSGGAQNETLAGSPHPNSLSHQGNSANMLVFNASAGENTEMKELKQSRKVNDPNGINHHHHHSSSRNASSNGHRVRDLDGPSSVKRDSSSQAANNALKEATNMKHMADRVKNAGSNLESTRLYFEAALKFLHGASLLEICSGESAKNGEPMQVYSSTAKLCEFCAHEYEKSKDMAAAALAYKCMEVAYMRAIYSSHTTANRDRHELQMALQIIPPGESPSSSASDIDNLNHTTIADKVPLTKGVSSPQVTGSHIIAARNRPNFVRLLRFAQDVNSAMEASRKSHLAFAAANVSLGEARCGDGISSIKTALDFNFQDVEGLLRLVRLAIEAISR